MLNKVKVVICGKDFTLQTAESSNYVFGLARTLESRITEITDANSSALLEDASSDAALYVVMPMRL